MVNKSTVLFFLSPIRTTPLQCISSRAGAISVWPTVSWNSTWLWTTALRTSCGSLTPTSLMTRSPSSTAWQWRTEWSGCTLTAPSYMDWGTNLSVFCKCQLFDGALQLSSKIGEHPVGDFNATNSYFWMDRTFILACLLFCACARSVTENKYCILRK